MLQGFREYSCFLSIVGRAGLGWGGAAQVTLSLLGSDTGAAPSSDETVQALLAAGARLRVARAGRSRRRAALAGR